MYDGDDTMLGTLVPPTVILAKSESQLAYGGLGYSTGLYDRLPRKRKKGDMHLITRCLANHKMKAQDHQLHRASLNMCKTEYERRKRLWYSLYVIDRWSCAVMGRPLTITDADCDVELPQQVYDGEDYTLFIHFIKLSGVLGDVLQQIYSVHAKVLQSELSTTVPRLQNKLTAWFDQLPHSYRLTLDDIRTMSTTARHPHAAAQLARSGPLMLCYYAVMLILLRPCLINEGRNDRWQQPYPVSSRCTEIAKRMIDLARMLSRENVLSFCVMFTGLVS